MTPEFSFMPKEPALVRCKVCMKRMEPGEERVKVLHHGLEYIVCCPSCAEKFRREPELYTVT